MERILFGAYHYEAHVDDIANEKIRLYRVMAAVEVRRHPPLEPLRFPHIYHMATLVDIHVDARRLREIEDLLPQVGPGAVLTDILTSAVGHYLDIKFPGFIDIPRGFREESREVCATGSILPFLIILDAIVRKHVRHFRICLIHTHGYEEGFLYCGEATAIRWPSLSIVYRDNHDGA